MKLFLLFAIAVSGFFVAGPWAVAAEAYKIPADKMPDVDYAYLPELHEVLEQAYLKVFQSSAGQEIFASFQDCSAGYLAQSFELRDQAAIKASLICEKSKKNKKVAGPDLSSPEFTPDHATFFKSHALPRRSEKRVHYLKVLKNGEPLESYTYIGNQVIIALPWELAKNSDILALFLLHETSVYFDAKNPIDFFGFLLRKNMGILQFSLASERLFQVWQNPFISETMQTMRAYQMEMRYLQNHAEVKSFFDQGWYQRLKNVSSPQSCATLVKSFITEVLFADQKYLRYRWSSSALQSSHPGYRQFSDQEIAQATLQDLSEFAKIEISLKKGKISFCEMLLIPDFSQEGNKYNNGPRPPIKPGSSAKELERMQGGSRE